MIAFEVQSALIALQQRASKTTDTYVLQRSELAMDELVRNVEKVRPAAFQLRSAWANAGKLIDNRRIIAPTQSLDDQRGAVDGPSRELGMVDGGYAVIDIHQWLAATPSVTWPERNLLRDLADGHDAESIAARDGLPITRVRERISRVRKVARDAYSREVAA